MSSRVLPITRGVSIHFTADLPVASRPALQTSNMTDEQFHLSAPERSSGPRGPYQGRRPLKYWISAWLPVAVRNLRHRDRIHCTVWRGQHQRPPALGMGAHFRSSHDDQAGISASLHSEDWTFRWLRNYGRAVAARFVDEPASSRVPGGCDIGVARYSAGRERDEFHQSFLPNRTGVSLGRVARLLRSRRVAAHHLCNPAPAHAQTHLPRDVIPFK